MANLRAMSARFPVYSSHGFVDSVDVVTGRVSDRILVLDQGMILAAIANALNDDVLVRAFSHGAVETAVRPLIALERFESGHTSDAKAEAEAELAPPTTPKVDSRRPADAAPVIATTADAAADWEFHPATDSPIPAPHLAFAPEPDRPTEADAPAPVPLGDRPQATVESQPVSTAKRRSRSRRRGGEAKPRGPNRSTPLC
jgi:hypothetical protein